MRSDTREIVGPGKCPECGANATLNKNARGVVLEIICSKGCSKHKQHPDPSSPVLSGNGKTDLEREWEPPIPFREQNLPAFPRDALPRWVRDFVEAEAEATQTAHDLAAMLSLSTIAAALARKVEVQVFEGYREPVNLYTLTALRPGARKSQVFRDIIKPLLEWERAEIERMEPEVAAAESKRRVAEAKLRKAEQDATGGAAEAENLARELAIMKTPGRPRLLADDCTPERLAGLMAEADGRIAVMSAEGGIFELIAGRYSQNGAPNLDVFLKAHTGDALMVDRVNRKRTSLLRPALTMGLTVQPDVIHSLTGKSGFRGRGLLGRFLYSMPDDRLGSRKARPAPMPSCIREAWNHNIKILLNLPFSTDDRDEPVPNILTLDDDGLGLWVEFSEWLEPQLATHGDLGHMTDWGGKLAGAVARIAALLHMAEYYALKDPWSRPINVDTVEKAISIGHYLLAHAKAAFSHMGADVAAADARYLLGHILRHTADGHEEVAAPRFRRRDAYQWTRSHFDSPSHLDRPMAILVEHNYIRPLPAPIRSGSGRPESQLYEVNPKAYPQNTQNTRNSS